MADPTSGVARLARDLADVKIAQAALEVRLSAAERRADDTLLRLILVTCDYRRLEAGEGRSR